MKIAVISPYHKFEEQIRGIAAGFPEATVDFYYADSTIDGYFARAIDYAYKVEKEGYDAIIARGTVYRAISQKMNTPVIYAGETLYDIIEALHKVKTSGNETRQVYLFDLEGSPKPDSNFVKVLNRIFHIELNILTYSSLEECKEILLNQVDRDGIVIAGYFSVTLCEEYGIENVLIESGYNTLYEAFQEAMKIVKIRKYEMLERNKIKTILDFAYEGIVYINRAMEAEILNPMAKRLLGFEENGVYEGKCLEDGELKKLCQRAITEGELITEEILTANNGTKIMCNVIPVLTNDEIKGLTVTFKEITRVIQMEKKIRRELTSNVPGAKYFVEDIIGESECIRACKKLVKQFGKYNSSVLIYGQTGTGKELFAQSIHNESTRKNEPFFAINCATLPEQLLESELFGYTEGSFTGAKKGGKPGLFELAHGGTLYLDEIAEMPMASQSKLLRVLQEGEIRRIGDDKMLPVDVRIIASSHKNLYEQIKDNNFREDLFYRLNVMSLTIPSLNDRREDIPYLIKHFLKLYKERFEVDRKIELDSGAIEFLMNYKWRGNVRQLQNFIERVYVYDLSDKVDVQQVRGLLREFDMLLDADGGLAYKRELPAKVKNLNEATTQIVKEAIDLFDGNRTRAASYLGVSRTYIWRKLKELE